jgi:hypothetical protein
MGKQTAVISLVVFVLAAIAGLTLGSRATAASVATTTTTLQTVPTTIPQSFFVDPEETVVGPAVVVADNLQLDGEQVTLDFALSSLAPVGDAASVTQFLGFQATEEVPPADLDTVYLDSWILTTAAGDIPGSVANPVARTVRFDVGDDFSLDAITSIKLDSYALFVPIDSEFDLSVANETAQVAPGITARLLAVTEQARTIIQVELISQRNFNYDSVRLVGAGPGWKSAVREAEGRPRWNLTYDAPQAPDPIPLRIAGSIWVSIESGAEVTVTR